MPLVEPPSGETWEIEERLRELLAADSDLAGLWDGNIRSFPPNNVAANGDGEGVVVSLHTADEDYQPETLGTNRVEPRLLLTVMVYESQSSPNAAEVRERLVRVTAAIRKSLWKIRRDPQTPCRWYALRFLQNPTTVYLREPTQYQVSRTQFEARVQARHS